MIATFDIPWIMAQQFSIEFKTDVDGEYTAHEQRNALWTVPRFGWVIDIHKNPQNYAALQAFFIARRGKWNAFYFVWDAVKGGDDQTYLVRFDTDKLLYSADEQRYSISIVQVVTTE